MRIYKDEKEIQMQKENNEKANLNLNYSGVLGNTLAFVEIVLNFDNQR